MTAAVPTPRMPLGVDHLQFSVPHLGEAVQYLEERGYARLFLEENFDDGAPFFRRRGKSLAFLAAGDTRLELIDGSEEGHHDQYLPVFGDGGGEIAEVPQLGAACRGVVGPRLSEIEVKVTDLERSARFWTAFGFRSPSKTRLTFPKTAFGMELSLELRLRADAGSHGLFVDDLGCSLVALIDPDPATTIAEVERAGGKAWLSHSLVIHGRSFHCHMLRGPDGEIVELLRFMRRRRDGER